MPEFVRIEYRQSDGSWSHGHAGIALLDPPRYIERLAARGIIARAVDPFIECEDCNARGCDGSCLI